MTNQENGNSLLFMNKNNFIKITFTAIVLFTLLFFTTCQTLMDAIRFPVVSFHSAEIVDINFTGTQLLCKLQVENPNPIEIPFPETGWEFFINGNSFTSAVIRVNERIRARSTVFVDVLVDLNYIDVFNAFASLIGSNNLGYKITLDIKFVLPVLGERILNFDHEGVIPIPQFPQLTAPSVRIENANLLGAEVVFTVNIQNPNPFDLPSPQITYDYQLNRSSFIRGASDNTGPLAASSTTPITLRLAVNYADLLRTFAALATANQVSSLFIFTCDFGIPVFAGDVIRLEIPGTLPLPRLF